MGEQEQHGQDTEPQQRCQRWLPDLAIPDPAGPGTGQLLPKWGWGWIEGQTELSPGGARTAPHTYGTMSIPRWLTLPTPEGKHLERPKFRDTEGADPLSPSSLW